jgi:hypothetical protein
MLPSSDSKLFNSSEREMLDVEEMTETCGIDLFFFKMTNCVSA